MRKIIVSNFVSLDGFIAGPNGETDWFVANEEFFDYALNLVKNAGTILYGRVTYQGMSSYFPTVTSPDDVMADRINNLPKVVVSKTLESAPWGKWNNTRLLKDNVAEEINQLKQQSGGDIVIYGSAGLTASLAQLGLIDEYQLVVCPVVLGKGIPQFKQPMRLNLLKSTAFKNGSILSYYQPAVA